MRELSFYSLLTSTQRQQAFRHKIDLLNLLSAQLEQTLLYNQLDVHLFVSLQTFRAFELYAARYQDLAHICRQITVFGESDIRPRRMPNIEFIALPSSSQLIKERFIIINHAKWQAMLLGQETPETQGRMERQRIYQGRLTFIPKVVKKSSMLAAALAGLSAPPKPKVDPFSQQELNAQFVTRLLLLPSQIKVDYSQVLQELTPIVTVTKQIAQQTTFVARLEEWMRQGALLTNAKRVTLYLHEGNMLRPIVSTERLDSLGSLLTNQSLIGRSVTSKRMIVASPAEAQQEASYTDCHSLVAIPIVNQRRKKVWGTIVFEANQRNIWPALVQRLPMATVVGAISALLDLEDFQVSALPSDHTPDTLQSANPATSNKPRKRIRLGAAKAKENHESGIAIPNPLVKLPDLPSKVTPDDPYADFQRRMVSYLVAFDRNGAERVWREAYVRFPAHDLCLNLLQPVMVAIGEGWHRGQVSVAAEHFSTHYVKSKINALFNSYPDNPNGAVILTGCAQAELHETGILLFSLFLRWRGYKVIYLGANVPNTTIPAALNDIKPDMLCLSATMKENAHYLIEVGHIVSQLPDSPPLFAFGGLAFMIEPELQQQIQGYYLGDDPHTALETVKNLLSTRQITR